MMLGDFVGKKVTLFCCRFFYTGILQEVGAEFVRLTDAAIVYETGPHGPHDKGWLDCQPLPADWHVAISAIESFGIMK